MKTINPPKKVFKLDVYLGYGEAGESKLIRIHQYRIKHKISLTKLVLDALKNTYEDLKL